MRAVFEKVAKAYEVAKESVKNKWEGFKKKFEGTKSEMSQEVMSAKTPEELITLGKKIQQQGEALKAEEGIVKQEELESGKLESEKSGMIESDHGEALKENKAFDEAKAAKSAEEEVKRKAELAEQDRLQTEEDAKKAAEILEKIKGTGNEGLGQEEAKKSMWEKAGTSLEIKKLLKDLAEKEKAQYIVMDSININSSSHLGEQIKLDQIRTDRQFAKELSDPQTQSYARDFSDYDGGRLKQEESNLIKQRDDIISEENKIGQRNPEVQKKLNILKSKISALNIVMNGGLDEVVASFKKRLEKRTDENQSEQIQDIYGINKEDMKELLQSEGYLAEGEIKTSDPKSKEKLEEFHNRRKKYDQAETKLFNRVVSEVATEEEIKMAEEQVAHLAKKHGLRAFNFIPKACYANERLTSAMLKASSDFPENEEWISYVKENYTEEKLKNG